MSQVRPSIYLANIICLWSALGNELIIPVNSSYSSSSFDNNIRTWSFMPARALRPVKLSSLCKTLARCSSISISANNMRYAFSLSFIGDFCFTGSPPYFIHFVFWAISFADRNRGSNKTARSFRIPLLQILFHLRTRKGNTIFRRLGTNRQVLAVFVFWPHPRPYVSHPDNFLYARYLQ